MLDYNQVMTGLWLDYDRTIAKLQLKYKIITK